MNIHIKISIVLLVIAAIAGIWYFGASKTNEARTDRTSYKVGDSLEVAISNNGVKPICFSSCYPYMIEKNENGKWGQYAYVGCRDANKASGCVASRSKRQFKLPLDEAEPGLSRLKIQICAGCDPGQEFRADEVIYSNEFEVK